MNRKWIAVTLSAVLLLSLTAACGKRDNDLTNGDSIFDRDNGTINGTNNGTNNGSGLGNSGTGTGSNSGLNNATGNNNGTNGSQLGSRDEDDPVFPNSLATTDADVAVDDLIATLGLTETDLETAMRDVSTVGDGVDGARTYRHKLLGHDSDVSYSFDDDRAINKVTVKTQKDYADDWRKEFNDTLRATAVKGKTDAWDYSDSAIQMSEDGDHFIITIEKPQV